MFFIGMFAFALALAVSIEDVCICISFSFRAFYAESRLGIDRLGT